VVGHHGKGDAGSGSDQLGLAPLPRKRRREGPFQPGADTPFR
jgi:hypothetical protein